MNLYLGPTLLSLSLCAALLHFSPQRDLWNFTLAISLLLGMIITILCQRELLKVTSEKKREREKKIEELEARHEEKTLLGLTEKYMPSASEISDKAASVPERKEENGSALEESREPQECLDLEITEGQTSEMLHAQLNELEIRHRELRKQFEEKSQVLDQTRRQLFLVENELLALRKDKEEEVLEENPHQIQLKHCFAEIHSLEGEVESLQDIVTNLLKKKTLARKSKKVKETNLDLFESQDNSV
jgi:hypothetical protein